MCLYAERMMILLRERRHLGGCWVVVSGDSTEPPIHCLVADTTHWTEGFLRSTGHLRV
jgi:hypothetical protein